MRTYILRQNGKERGMKNLLFYLAVAVGFLLGFGSGGFQVVLINIGETFELTNATMGTVVAMKYAALIVMPPLFGFVSDKVGKKPILIIFMSIITTGYFVASFAPSQMVFMSGIFLVGAGYGVSECLFTAALSDSDPDKAEKKINVMQAFFNIGAVSSPLIVSFLMSRDVGWPVAFILVGVGFALLLPILLFTTFHEIHLKQQIVKSQASTSKLFGSKLFVLIFVSLLVYAGLEIGVAYFADSFLTVELVAPRFGGLAISIFWFSTIMSRLMFSRLNIDALRAVYLLYGLTFFGFVALALNSSLALTLILYAVVGFLMGPLWGLLMATATKSFASQSGAVASVLTAGCGTGAMLFPIVLGLVADGFGLRASMVLLAGFSMLVFLQGRWALRRRWQDTNHLA